MTKFSKKNYINNNSGFTLVELIVVLVLVTILISLTIFGGLAWQDWTKFKHENTTAESIFYAAQNQITELDMSGALKKKTSVLLNGDDYDTKYVLGKYRTSSTSGELYFDIFDDDKEYTWDNIWENGTSNVNKDKVDKTIIRLTANSGDYDEYLKYKSGSSTDISEDTILLFDLVSHYLADTSVLNGCISLEFSPEAAQVFAVCFSDNCKNFTYSDGTTSILNRTEKYRKSNQIGYYNASMLSEKIKGRGSDDSKIILEIENGNLLLLHVNDIESEIANSDILTFTVRNGNSTDKTTNTLFSFKIPKSDIIRNTMAEAVSNPTAVTVSFAEDVSAYSTDKEFRIPIWKVGNEILVILDAADVQAATTVYNKAVENPLSDEAKDYRNTYSFSRFLLKKDINYIYATLTVTDEDEENPKTIISSHGGPVQDISIPVSDMQTKNHEGYTNVAGKFGECIYFATYDADSNIEITNARHFYNMRYLTEYKEDTVERNFILANNIDWNEFTDDNVFNYFLNSYNVLGSGINNALYNFETINGVKRYPFPSFRCLGFSDTFKVKENENYVISNLFITFDNNVRCGIYDDISYKESASIMESIRTNSSNYTKILGLSDATAKDSTGSNLTRGGAMPLGLFCENLGTVSDITLNKHIVRGIESGINIGAGDENVVCTNMVGGFIGNNLGSASNLKLLDENADGSKANVSMVNGRTDVGGIIGRESFATTDENRNKTLTNLENYALVTGLENVGGIIGRAYTHYVGDVRLKGLADVNDTYHVQKNFENEKLTVRYRLMHDGYFITDQNKSMTGAEIVRADKIDITDCKNHGAVYGDSAFTATRHAFIGGIAGATVDGFMADGANKVNISKYRAWGFFSDSFYYVKVTNCESFVKLDDLASINAYVAAHSGDFGDYYVGGLVGYAKLTIFDNCNAEPIDMNGLCGAPSCYVIGTRYVGGLAGCADMTYFREPVSGYSATNYNNVIGKMYVGGIAGSFGIGHEQQADISFRNPSANTAGRPSQDNNDGTNNINSTTDKNIVGNHLLNTGVVLGLKNSADNFLGDNLTEAWNTTACIGGITGATRACIANCDNIQSENTKNLALYLITSGQLSNVQNLNGMDAEAILALTNNSAFGGNYVGGIVGYTLSHGHVNPYFSTQESKIDALVYGENAVGGVYGSSFGSDAANWKMVRNCYPYKISNVSSGMLVLGHNAVGGLAGLSYDERCEWRAGITNYDYKVYGNYAVGGIIGVKANVYTSNSNTSTVMRMASPLSSNITVNAVASAGAFIGFNEHMNTDDVNVDFKNAAVSVRAKYFAGGVYGALYQKNAGASLDSIINKKVKNTDNIYTEATTAFAGGVSGLYVNSRIYSDFKNNDSTFRTMFNTCSSDFTNFLYTKWPTYGNNSGTRAVVTFNEYNTSNVSITGTVTAPIFAGGLFGFVSDSSNVKISGFANGCRVYTTSSVTNMAECSNKSYYMSYLGGVTGRVGKNNIITNCSNPMGQKDNYKSTAANMPTFMGMLAEVNMGLIEGTENSPFINLYDINYENYPSAVSAFVGINGMIPFGERNGTDGINNGVIRYCENYYKIQAPSATAFAGMLDGKSKIDNCKNTGQIISNDVAAGLALYAFGTSQILGSVNEGNINAALAAGLIAYTDGNADFTLRGSINKGIITGTNSAGFIALSNSTLTISDCVNEGEIIAATSGAGILNTANIPEGKTVFIERVANNAKVSGSAAYAAGIVASAQGSGALQISNSEESSPTPAAKNAADIQSGGIAAGIMAATSCKTAIYFVENTAQISGEAASGIFGNSLAETYIENAVNYGNVLGNTKASGILLDADNATVMYCRNYGLIYANSQVSTTNLIATSPNAVIYGALTLSDGASDGIISPSADQLRNFFVCGKIDHNNIKDVNVDNEGVRGETIEEEYVPYDETSEEYSSSWPVQLYLVKNDNYYLAYKRWQTFFKMPASFSSDSLGDNELIDLTRQGKIDELRSIDSVLYASNGIIKDVDKYPSYGNNDDYENSIQGYVRAQ